MSEPMNVYDAKTQLSRLIARAEAGEQGFETLPFTASHAGELRHFPWVHRDPFDRMLISQARSEGLVFLTADARCREYDIVTR